MKRCLPSLPALAAAALLTAGACLPGHAESFASSASSAGSASSGSVSDSIGASSNGSKQAVAEGPYRVMEVALAPDHPGKLRLTLRAEAQAANEFFLYVPQQALAARALAAGDRVQASRRPYGWEFAHADTRTAFFLALEEGWQRDLDSRVVTF
ncbi:MAG: hypothetical protein QM740_04225 [Acidovorax sp.]